jgi:uncharacterized membrane protein YphA (DoxX/SURF4 family)
MRDLIRHYAGPAGTVIRFLIGAIFVYAGSAKLGDSLQFADNIASFQLLPAVLVNPLALALPPLEIAAGVLTIGGWPRVGALALVFLVGVFCLALLLDLARGIEVNCGCFGAGSDGSTGLNLTRDLALLAAALIAYRSAAPHALAVPTENSKL